MGSELFKNSRLMLSAGTIPRANFTERVKAAARAGFDAISLFPQQYLATRRKEKLSPADMRGILAEHNMSLDEVDPLLDWFSPEATRSEHLMMEMADELGARSINVSAAFVSNRPFEELVDQFSRVCERAAQHGLRTDFEFLPWTRIGNLTEALKLVETADQPDSGLMLDFWHFFNSGDDLDTLHQLTPQQAARITSLQVNDLPASIEPLNRRQKWEYTKDNFQSLTDSVRVMGLDAFLNVAIKAEYPHPNAQKMMADSLCSRLLPGQGIKPIAEILSILAQKGAQPTIGIETFNLDQYSLPAEQVAVTAMEAYRATEEQALPRA